MSERYDKYDFETSTIFSKWNTRFWEYRNRSYDRIKRDVERRFEEIEDKDENLIIHYRDDQQILRAWRELADRYKKQMLSAKHLLVKKDQYIVDKNWKAVLFKKWNEYWKAAEKFIDEAIKKFKNKHDNLKWMKITSSEENRRWIREVSIDLDEAENDALFKIQEYCNPMQESKNAEYHSSIVKSKKWFFDFEWTPVVKDGKIETQQPMYNLDNKTWYLTFTSRCNPLSFDNAVSWLYDYMRKKKNGKYPWFKIDYSKCKNEKVKQKMKKGTGSYAGDLYYDNDKKKCYIIWNNGSIIEATKIWIYEWVMMKRQEIFVDEAREKERKRKEELWEVKMKEETGVSPENDPEMKDLVDQIPEKLRNILKNNLTVSEYRKFIIETEKGLNKIALENIRYGHELHVPPVSGCYKINLISGESEHSVKFEAESILWENIWGKIKDKKWEYREYLTNRIQSKRVEFWEVRYVDLGKYAKSDRLEDHYETDEKNLFSQNEISEINQWISLLEEWFNELKNKEWDSWLDDDDNACNEAISQLKDLSFKVNTFWRMVNKTEIIDDINKASWVIGEKFNYYATKKEMFKGSFKNDFISILSPGIKIETKIQKVRNLDRLHLWLFLASWTSAYLWKTILEQRDNLDLEFKDAYINKYFSNIDKYLSTDDVDFDERGNVVVNENTKRIDKLYACGSSQAVAQCLVNFDIFPASWKYDEEVIEKCRDLYKFLQRRKSEISGVSVDWVKKWIEAKQQQLFIKNPRSKDEETVLNELNALLWNDELLNKYCEVSLNSSKNMMKYSWIDDEIAVTFWPIYGDKSGWMVEKWRNSVGYIFNDIQWYWFFNLSDKTSAMIWELAVDLILTVVCSVAAWAVLAGVWSLIEKSVKIMKWVDKIKAVLRVARLSLRGYWKFWVKFSSWLGRHGIDICKTSLKTVCTNAIKNFDIAEMGVEKSLLTMAIGTLAAWLGTFWKKLISKLKDLKDTTQATIESLLTSAARSGLSSTVNKSGDDYTLVVTTQPDDEFNEIFWNEKIDLSSIKFYWNYVDASWNKVGAKQIDAADLLAGITALWLLMTKNPSLFNQYKSNIQNGTFSVAFWKDNKVYLKDVHNWWNTVLFTDLCSGRAMM